MPRKQSKTPWGQCEEITKGAGYRVNRLTIEPEQRLSLHRHQHRAEAFVVVSGQAWVTLGNSSDTLFSGDAAQGMAFRAPLGVLHRIGNPGKTPLIIIETQVGECDEKDIDRVEDPRER